MYTIPAMLTARLIIQQMRDDTILTAEPVSIDGLLPVALTIDIMAAAGNDRRPWSANICCQSGRSVCCSISSQLIRWHTIAAPGR